jgi:hypothetical protein
MPKNAATVISVCLVVALAGFVLASEPPNRLSADEARSGFVLLFNGRDLDGWSPADGPWEVRDNAICFRDLKSWAGVDMALVCERQVIPGDFDLRFEWREPPAGSEFMPGVFHIGNHRGIRETEVEWTGPLFCSYLAGDRGIELLTNDVSIPLNQARFTSSANPSHDARLPAGQWNIARMTCKGPEFRHWVNGKEVLSRNLSKKEDAHYLTRPNGDSLLKQWLELKQRGFRLQLAVLGRAVAYRSIRVRAIDVDEQIR